MGSTTVNTLATSFISEIWSNVTDNLGLVLTFAAAILVWVILKKWIFGGTSRI